MTGNKCKCDSCEFLLRYCPRGGIRCQYFCEHPNREYIEKYFTEKGLKSMPTFIGFVKPNEHKNRRTPKWCPMLNSEEEDA